MRVFSASILLIALLAQHFSHYLVVLQYDLNKDYIARNLCENRDKPKSCCQGKCFLKKQLAKHANEENAPNNNTKKDRNEIQLFTQKNSFRNSMNEPAPESKYFIHTPYFKLNKFYSTVFHPPQV
jgi:hypothetical protein